MPIFAAALGCGGESDRDSARDPLPPIMICEALDACGGDPVGNWQVVETCNPSSPLRESMCDGGVVSFEQTGLEVQGSLSIGADGAATLSTSSRETREIVVPDACGGTDCAALEDDYGNPGAGSARAQCTSSDGACRCSVELVIPRTSASVTWTVSNSTLTLEGSGLSFPFEYCRQGAELRLRSEGLGLRLQLR